MPATRSSLKSLIPYLPFSTVLGLVENNRISRAESLRGGVLFIDVAGFTPMSAALGAQGQAGMQALQEIMSRYYNGLLDFVREFGGTVYQFAGDSILAGLAVQPGESEQAACLRVARCVQDLHASVADFAEFEALGARYTIQTKAGAAFGDYHVLLLGQRNLWFHPALVGPAVEQAVGAELQARPGQSIIAGDLLRRLPVGAATGEALPVDDYYLLRELDGGGRFNGSFRLPDNLDEARLFRRCSYFIQDALLKKFTTGHRGFTGDFRNVTSLFLRFEGLDYTADARAIVERLDAFFRFVQNEARTSGGLLLQIDLTDKGGMLMILFGAPTAIENKEAAAARLALRVISRKSEFPFLNRLQAGIATGDAYCGDLGASFRKTYSALAGSTNLAARLAAFGDDDAVHLDDNTMARLPRRFTTQLLSGISFKGLGDDHTIYRLLSEKELHGFFSLHQDTLIGRKAELAFLNRRLDLSVRGNGSVTAIIGEAGVGKSRLVSAFMQEMLERDVLLIGGHCFSYERHTPFFPWKELLLQLFVIPDGDSLERKVEKIEARLQALPDVSVDWALAFAVLLGLPATERPVTRQLDPREKNLRLFQIIYLLLENVFRDRPGCLYFEDVHWMDETSFRLIEYLVARIQNLPIIVLLSLRPDPILDQMFAASSDGRANGEPVARLDLGHFSEADAREFVRYRLRLDEQETRAQEQTRLEDLILQAAQGNPFFIETIVDSLVEQGHIQLQSPPGGDGAPERDGRRLATKIEQIRLPGSLRDVVLARLDSLDENSQVTLKTAAVIGRVFPFETLRNLLPETLSHDQAEDCLIDLERMDLTRLETPNPLEYIFKHVVIRDVAYESMLLSTREYIHRRLAEFLEQAYRENLRERAETLAFHYLQGNEPAAALRYLTLAGEKARDNYANRDAISYYEHAVEVLSAPDFAGPAHTRVEEREMAKLEILASVKQSLAEVRSRIGDYDRALDEYRECLDLVQDPMQLAQIHLGMGLIHQERGEPRAAVREMERTMKLLGARPPRSKAGTIFSLLGQFAIRFLYAKLPFLIRRVPKEKRAGARFLLRAIRTLEKMYFLVDLEKFAWGGVYGLNLATRVQDPAELSQFYGAYGMMLGGMGLKDAARKHLAQGLEIARKTARNNPLVEGLLLQLNGTQHMFWDDPATGLPALEDSIHMYRRAGGMWELLTSLGTQGQLLFLLSRFEESRQKYDECGEIARDLNSAVHMGWQYCKSTFCEYLLADLSVESVAAARAGLGRAIELSVQAEDLMNHMITCAHLANIACHNGDADEAARLATGILEINRRYKVNVPHVKIALVDAADAALFALETARTHGAAPDRALLKIARAALGKARALGKTFPYMRGPAERARARYVHFTKGPARARPIYERALRLLDPTPHHRERGQAYAGAATVYATDSEERRRYVKQAREIFTEYGIRAELGALERM